MGGPNRSDRDRVFWLLQSPLASMLLVVATNAARAGCDAVPTIDQRHPTVRVDTYQGCGTHRVEYWQMQGNGHTWAGTPGILDLFVGTTNTDFSATTAVLDFFDGTTV